jgi:WD40 repeat protein
VNLHGPVRPPDAAGPGTAAVTVSLDSWPAGRVVPTTYAIEVVRPKGIARPEPVSPRLLRSLVHPERKAVVSTVRFSPDGRRLFAAGYPSTILQFWDVAGGKELRRIDGTPAYRSTAEYALLPDDWSAVFVPWEKQKIVRFERNGQADTRKELDGGVTAYDAATGRPRPGLKAAAGHSAVTADLSPDGQRLVVLERPSSGRGEQKPDQVVLWDVPAGTRRVIGEGYPMAAFTPDSRRIALALSASPVSTLKLFDRYGSALAELARVKGERLTWPRVSPDGRRLAVEQGAGRIDLPATIRVWDLETRKELAAFRSAGNSPFRDFAFSPDGNRLAAADYDGGLRVWDVATGKPVREAPATGMVLRHVAFAPDGARLAVLGQPKWDPKEFAEPDALDLPQPRVLLFDLRAPAVGPEVIVCPHGYLGGLAYSPDGRTLAVGGAAVHLFDVAPR